MRGEGKDTENHPFLSPGSSALAGKGREPEGLRFWVEEGTKGLRTVVQRVKGNPALGTQKRWFFGEPVEGREPFSLPKMPPQMEAGLTRVPGALTKLLLLGLRWS